MLHSILSNLRRLLIATSRRELHHVSIPADIRGNVSRHVYSKAGGLGDELMAVGIIQAAIRQFPEWKCIYHTRYPQLLQHVERPSAVVTYDATRLPNSTLTLTYGSKSRYSLNAQMAGQLGIQPECYEIELPAPPPVPLSSLGHLPTKLIVIQPGASPWTPNKQWPLEHWLQLLAALPAEWTILEVGAEALMKTTARHPRFLSVAGKTSLLEYASWIKQADAFVGPPSSGMHLAHAYRVPSVILIGGYEAANYPYPRAKQLGTNVFCAPCWLRTPCPYDRRCLREITVEQVYQAVLAQLASGVHQPRNPK